VDGIRIILHGNGTCDLLTPSLRLEFTSKSTRAPADQAQSEEVSGNRQIEGTAKHWRGEFGFVLGDDGAEYFLHSRECLKSGIAFPKCGTA
jgi:hypothetical protein